MAPPAKKRAKITSVPLELNAENVSDTSLISSSSLWSYLNLSRPIMQAIDSMKFHEPTEIQKKVIPLAIEKNYDILGAAETGSGKTLAFAIPILEKWLSVSNEDFHELFALVIVPTRELVEKEIKRLSAFIDKPPLRTVALFGGISQQKQERLLKKRPHVVVGTPGRLWALVDSYVEHLDDLSTVKILVVDEVDRMLEKGHFQELEHIIERVHANVENSKMSDDVSSSLQTLVFSATLTFVHAPVMRKDGSFTNKQTTSTKIHNFAKFMQLRERRHVVDLTKKNITPSSLSEYRMQCSDLKQKDANLYYLLNRHRGRTLIFTNSIDASRRLYNLLGLLKVKPTPCILHAKMHEKKRLSNLEKFTVTEDCILLATDLAARGLDILGIDNVVHYQVPKTSEIYVHRSGRTARASRSGLSVLFVDPLDVQLYKRLYKNLNWGKDPQLLDIDSPELMHASIERMNIAVELESIVYNLKKTTSKNEWFKRLAKEADIVLDENLVDDNDENGSDVPLKVLELRRQQKKYEKALNFKLRQPLPNVLNGKP